MSKKKSSRQMAIGFFREDGVIKPITKTKTKKVVVRKVSKESFEGGKIANLKMSLKTEDGTLKIDTPIRWETQKVNKLVKTEWRTTDGILVKVKYLGGGKKRKAFVDVDGNERSKDEVILVQVLPDGERQEITPFKQTTAIKAEARSKVVMNEFLPTAFLEVWADSTDGQKQLRQLAWYLLRSGRVAAVRSFARGTGKTAYVGFLYPVLSPDGKTFGMEMMISENRRDRQRWMPSEPSEVVEPEEEDEELKPDIPELF